MRLHVILHCLNGTLPTCCTRNRVGVAACSLGARSSKLEGLFAVLALVTDHLAPGWNDLQGQPGLRQSVGRCRAKLLKRSSETSQAAVQLTEDFSVHKLSFDQIAEFVGELGEEE